MGRWRYNNPATARRISTLVIGGYALNILAIVASSALGQVRLAILLTLPLIISPVAALFVYWTAPRSGWRGAWLIRLPVRLEELLPRMEAALRSSGFSIRRDEPSQKPRLAAELSGGAGFGRGTARVADAGRAREQSGPRSTAPAFDHSGGRGRYRIGARGARAAQGRPLPPRRVPEGRPPGGSAVSRRRPRIKGEGDADLVFREGSRPLGGRRLRPALQRFGREEHIASQLIPSRFSPRTMPSRPG